MCEINNNHTVTPLFHHKTKQHRTPLNWTEQHCGSTIDLKQLRSNRKFVGFICCRSSLAHWDNFASWPRIVLIIIIKKNFNKHYSIFNSLKQQFYTVIQRFSLVNMFRPSGKELHVHFKRIVWHLTKCVHSLDMTVTTSHACVLNMKPVSTTTWLNLAQVLKTEGNGLHLAKCRGC